MTMNKGEIMKKTDVKPKLEVRIRGGFADRIGIKKENIEIQYTILNDRTRIHLINSTNELLFDVINRGENDAEKIKQTFYQNLLKQVYIQEVDHSGDTSYNDNEMIEIINSTIKHDEYSAVFSLIEFIANYLTDYCKEDKNYPYEFYNKVFDNEFVGYKFDDRKIYLIKNQNSKNSQIKDYSFINVLKDWGAITAIVVLILTLLAGVHKTIVLHYYHISTQFLSFKATELFSFLFDYFILISLSILIPIYIYSYENKLYLAGIKNDISNKASKVIFFIISTIIIGKNFSDVVFKVLKYNFNQNVDFNIVALVCFLIVILGMWFLYFNINSILTTKSSESKINFFVIIKLLAAATVCLYLLYILFFGILGVNLQYKTRYNTIKYNNSDYVIVTVNDTKAIIAKFDENKKCIYTDSYIIVELTDKEINSLDFKAPPSIE